MASGSIRASSVSRRTLLGAAASTAALSLAGPANAQRRRRWGPNDRVNVAAIGAGGMGSQNMSALTSQNIVAIADVDFEHVANSLRGNDGNVRADRQALNDAYNRADRHTDYRRMFDRHRNLDAVVIATPDHHHAIAARMAMERGIHVYVQKPLTYSVHESRTLLALARANPRLVTQMGNQGHSSDDGRRIIEIIRGGAIGNVREVHVWTNRPVWPQGVPKPEPQTPPETLDWEIWKGPADVDWGFHPSYGHFNWRGWLPFGTGALGDMGAHLMDFPIWALEPGLPTRIETRHTLWGGDDNLWDARPPANLTSYPLACVTHYEFANAPSGPVTMTWYDGGLMPPTPPNLPEGATMNPEGGVLMIGDAGALLHGTYGHDPIVFGDGAAERAAAIPHSLPRIEGGQGGHEMNWIRAIRGEDQISCPFEYAAQLTETMLLGMVALRAEQPIHYDGQAGRVTNSDAANQFLTRAYREGWEL